MKRRILIACAVLAMVFASAQDYNIPFRPRTSGCAACSIAFSEKQTDITEWGPSGSDFNASVAITLAANNGAVVFGAFQAQFTTDCETGDVTISDGANTYSLVKLVWDGTNEECIYAFYSGVTSGGAKTITATFVTTAAWKAIGVAEYTGVGLGAFSTVSDATPVSATSANTVWSTGTIATGCTQSLLVGVNIDTSGGTTNTVASGENERVDTNPLFLEDRICADDASIGGTVAGASVQASIGFAIKP